MFKNNNKRIMSVQCAWQLSAVSLAFMRLTRKTAVQYYIKSNTNHVALYSGGVKKGISRWEKRTKGAKNRDADNFHVKVIKI